MNGYSALERARSSVGHMRTAAAGALTGLGLLAALAGEARATVVNALSLHDKCEVAKVIVHGRVRRVETRWVVEGRKVETIVTVEVLEPLKGDVRRGGEVGIWLGAGRIGTFDQRIPGISAYQVGEEAVLFLEPWDRYLVEIGVGIGKYPVDPSMRTIAMERTGVAELRRAEGGAPARIKEVEPEPAVPLRDFLKQVRTIVRTAKR